jgi:hypothetical protein
MHEWPAAITILLRHLHLARPLLPNCSGSLHADSVKSFPGREEIARGTKNVLKTKHHITFFKASLFR